MNSTTLTNANGIPYTRAELEIRLNKYEELFENGGEDEKKHLTSILKMYYSSFEKLDKEKNEELARKLREQENMFDSAIEVDEKYLISRVIIYYKDLIGNIEKDIRKRKDKRNANVLRSANDITEDVENIIDDEEDDEISRCIICHDDLFPLYEHFLPCGHCYHENCISRWLQNNRTCPTCRAVVQDFERVEQSGIINNVIYVDRSEIVHVPIPSSPYHVTRRARRNDSNMVTHPPPNHGG
jgi:rubrerythrin